MIQIENFSDVEQHAYTPEGIRHSIAPLSVILRSPEVANLFLEQRGRYVRVHTPSKIPDIAGETRVWIANMSGNPTVPKDIDVEETDAKTGKKSFFKKVNALSVPKTIKYRMQRGQEYGYDQDGYPTSANLPSVLIKIPAFTRIQAPISIAKWLEMMDGNQDDTSAHRMLIICRGPTEYEPNESWDYDDIRQYAIEMGTTIDFKKSFPAGASLKKDTIDKAKEDLLQAVFFFLVDPRFSLPPRQVVEAARLYRQTAPKEKA